MVKPLRLAMWAGVLASVMGCASAESPEASSGVDEHTHSVTAPIIGGTLDTTTHGVVALAVENHGHAQVFCSGSLLAQNLVLTARHCISQIGDGSSEQVDCATSQFTTAYSASFMAVSSDAQPQQGTPTFYPVKQILQAPGSTTVCGFDVALLVLSGSGIPSAVATPIAPALDTSTLAKTVFSAVGYGIQDPTDTQGATAGSRMRFDSAYVYCVGQSCPVAAQNKADEWVGNSPVCSGDSGGPALDSQGRVFGVTSRGDSQCSYALYSNVANWADFIRSTALSAAAAGGYSPPAWAAATSTTSDAGVTELDSGVNESDAGSAGSGAANAAGESGAGPDAGGMPPPSQAATPTVNPLGQQCSGDCPGIYKCFSDTKSPPGICVPPCDQVGETCPADYSCSSSLKYCVPTKDVQSEESSGCALRTPRESNGNAGWTALIALGCAWFARRRRAA
jgi:V8-like Glu-specific endopeptidase